jgi:hypothetical protein
LDVLTLMQQDINAGKTFMRVKTRTPALLHPGRTFMLPLLCNWL